MDRRKSHSAVGRWLFRNKDGATVSAQKGSQQPLPRVGSSSSAPLQELTAFGPDTNFPSVSSEEDASLHPSLENSANSVAIKRSNSHGSTSAKESAAASSSERSNSTKDTQSMTTASSLSIRSMVSTTVGEETSLDVGSVAKPRRSFMFALDKNKTIKPTSRKSFSFVEKTNHDKDKQDSSNKLETRPQPRKSFSILDRNAGTRNGTPLSPTKRKKVLEAVLLMQDFEAAPTTNIVTEEKSNVSTPLVPLLQLQQQSSTKLLKSTSSREIEAPASPAAKPKRRDRQRSGHTSRNGIKEIDTSGETARRKERIKRKSLSDISREELERLAATIPKLPHLAGGSNLSAGSQRKDKDSGRKVDQIPPAPSALVSNDEAGATSGEGSEDSSDGSLIALQEDKDKDEDIAILGTSTVSMVMDDFNGDSQSGLLVSPLPSPPQTSKRSSTRRDESEREIQRLLASLRELNALTESDERDFEHRADASTSQFDVYVSSDVDLEDQQYQAPQRANGNTSMSYVNCDARAVTTNARMRPTPATLLAPDHHESFHDSFDNYDVEEEDDDVVQRLLSVQNDYDHSHVAPGSGDLLRRGSYGLKGNDSRSHLLNASAAGLVFEDAFEDDHRSHVSPLSLQPSRVSPMHPSPRRASHRTPPNRVTTARPRQSMRLEQLHVASFSHHDDDDEMNDELLSQQEEEMIRIALERSLHDSQSAVYAESVARRAQPTTDDTWEAELNGFASEYIGQHHIDTTSGDVHLPPNTAGEAYHQIPSLASDRYQEDIDDFNGSNAAFSLQSDVSQQFEIHGDDCMLALNDYSNIVPLTQAEQDLLDELALEQELHNSLSSQSQFYDDRTRRSHRSHHSQQSQHSMASRIVDLSGMLVSHAGAAQHPRNSFLVDTAEDDYENDDEAALLAVNAMVMQAQQHPPPNMRRVLRASSTRSQSSVASHLSNVSQRSSHTSSRASFVSQSSASRTSFVSQASASTIDGRPRPLYDWERELIARSDDGMDASVDAVEGFYEEESEDFGTSPHVYMPAPQSLRRTGRQSSGTNSNYGRQSSTSSAGESQHWARRPPGRTRSNDSNDGIEQFYIEETDNDPLPQNLPFQPQRPHQRDVVRQQWQHNQSDAARSVSQAEMEHLILLEQEMMELALHQSIEGEFYENM